MGLRFFSLGKTHCASPIARVVREEIRKANVRSVRQKSKEQAAQYLCCSEATIDNLVQQGRLHPSYYTRWPTFDIDDLDALIEKTRKGKPEEKKNA